MRIVTLPVEVLAGEAVHIYGIVEATREELRALFPERIVIRLLVRDREVSYPIVDRLPEGPTRYAFGCWTHAGCDCPTLQAGAPVTNATRDAVEAYDRHCIELARRALAEAEENTP